MPARYLARRRASPVRPPRLPTAGAWCDREPAGRRPRPACQPAAGDAVLGLGHGRERAVRSPAHVDGFAVTCTADERPRWLTGPPGTRVRYCAVPAAASVKGIE